MYFQSEMQQRGTLGCVVFALKLFENVWFWPRLKLAWKRDIFITLRHLRLFHSYIDDFVPQKHNFFCQKIDFFIKFVNFLKIFASSAPKWVVFQNFSPEICCFGQKVTPLAPSAGHPLASLVSTLKCNIPEKPAMLNVGEHRHIYGFNLDCRFFTTDQKLVSSSGNAFGVSMLSPLHLSSIFYAYFHSPTSTVPATGLPADWPHFGGCTRSWS